MAWCVAETALVRELEGQVATIKAQRVELNAQLEMLAQESQSELAMEKASAAVLAAKLFQSDRSLAETVAQLSESQIRLGGADALVDELEAALGSARQEVVRSKHVFDD